MSPQSTTAKNFAKIFE